MAGSSTSRWKSSAVAKFLLATVFVAILGDALTQVFADRTATAEVQQRTVRELSETVNALATSRLIAGFNQTPGSYLAERCFQGLGGEKRSTALKEACEQAPVDEILQEQEMANRQRDLEGKLRVLSEVARGDFEGEAPANAITDVATAQRLLRRLTSSNSPSTREVIVADLVELVEVEEPDQRVLVESVKPGGAPGRYDVQLTDEFGAAFDRAEAEAVTLTAAATEEIRDAEVRGRTTSFGEAALGVLTDPLVIVALVVGLGLALFARGGEAAAPPKE